jgi:hypothetical protein
MKNLKAFLFILFFVNLFKIHSQNQNSKNDDSIKSVSQELYIQLNKKSDNPLVLINRFFWGNDLAFKSLINPKDVDKIDIIKDTATKQLNSKHRKYKMWIITLKDKNINTVEKFKTAYGIQNTNSQKQKISGVVYDENKKRIPNVFISNLNRKESYKTDSDGKYLFTAQENDILVFYLDGFKSKTAKVKGPNLDVFLETNLKKKN